LNSILNGLFKEGRALQIEQIVLPTSEQIGALMNYPTIVSKMNELIQNKPKVKIEYTSKVIRKKIEDFESDYLTMDYDEMSKNEHGILFLPPNESEYENIQTTSTSKILPALSLNVNINKAELFGFILESEFADETEFASKAMRILKISDADYSEFSEATINIIGKVLKRSDIDTDALEKVSNLIGKLNANPEQVSQFEKLKNDKEFSSSVGLIWTEAIRNSDIKALKKLSKLKLFDINSKNGSGFSPLVVAIYFEQMEIIDWLVKNPSLDLNIMNDQGLTDIEQARLMGKDKLADYIEIKRPESKSRKFVFKERNKDGSPVVDFVPIHPGTFMMGAADNRVKVTITKSYNMSSIQTTQKTWRLIIDLANNHLAGKISLNSDPSRFSGDQNPVERVSYNDVVTWFQALNELSKIDNLKIQEKLKKLFPGHKLGSSYRLPTEAEFALVSRIMGLGSGNYSFTNNDYDLLDSAWYSRNSNSQTYPVGLKKPLMINGNPIYDISGNVWEYVSNFSGRLQGGVDPQGPSSGSKRIAVGGSCLSDSLRLSFGYRNFIEPNHEQVDMGFRIVRD
jgi:formylglycine-generating enzyme required for sulfatase activity